MGESWHEKKERLSLGRKKVPRNTTFRTRGQLKIRSIKEREQRGKGRGGKGEVKRIPRDLGRGGVGFLGGILTYGKKGGPIEDLPSLGLKGPSEPHISEKKKGIGETGRGLLG